MSEETQEARKSGKAKNVLLGMVLGAVAIVIAIVGGMVWIGFSTPVEEYVADLAAQQNQYGGRQLDEVTRFDQASANGALLTVSHTLSDGWYASIYDAMSEQGAQELGRKPNDEEILMALKSGFLSSACKLRPELVHAEGRIIYEYHDEQGQPVMSVEANEATCESLASQ